MTENESIVEQIVRSLSFEVLAIPNQSQKVPSSTSKATPLNVKIRVKKKHESGLQHRVLAIPVKGPNDVPQRIRLVSSDQTIMSFNAVMEDIDLDISKVRQQNIDNEANTSSATEVCQSAEGALKNKFILSKINDDSNKKKDIFGRCKPGGCLDPPFGEDKYSYEPTKQQLRTKIQGASESKRTSSIFNNKLFKKLKKQKTENTNVKNDEIESIQSVISLYETGSLQTSAYSNSIITYPSPSNESNDKMLQSRQKSPKNSATRKSNESDNGSLYIVPKKTRAPLENEELKLKSERDNTNFDLSERLGNKGDARKLDDVDKIDPSVVNNLNEERAEYLNTKRQQFEVKNTVDGTNYQDKMMLRTGPEIEDLSHDLNDSTFKSKKEDMGDNITKIVKTGLILVGVADATGGIASTVLEDLKDNKKTTSDETSVEKLSGNNNEDLNVVDKKRNLTILNDDGDSFNETAIENITDDKSEHGGTNNLNEERGKYLNAEPQQLEVTNTVDSTNYQDKIMLCTGTEIEDSSDDQTYSNFKSKKEDTGDNATKIVKTGLVSAGVAAATGGIASTFLEDLKDSNKTRSGYTSVDKLSGNNNENLNVDDNKRNLTILNDDSNNFNETAIGNITDDKTERDSINNLNEERGKYLSAELQQLEDTNTVDGTNYQHKIMLRTRPEIEDPCDDLTDITFKSKLENTGDSATKTVKTGLISADVAAATGGIAGTLLEDLKDNNKTTSDDTSVEKLSGNNKEDLNVDDNKRNLTILNDDGNNFNERAIGNITDDKTEHGGTNNLNEEIGKYLNAEPQQLEVTNTVDGTNYQDKIMFRAGPEIEDSPDDQADSNFKSKKEETGDNVTKIVKTGLISAGVAAATDCIASTLLEDLKDNNKTTSDYTLVDKLSGNNSEDLSVDDKKRNLTGDNFDETAVGNITDGKTEHGGIDDDDQLLTNRIDDSYLDIKKYDSISIEDGKILTNKDSSKVAQGVVAVSEVLDDINIVEDLNTDKLVFKNDGNMNKIHSDLLSDNRKFDNKLSSLDKLISKNDIVEEIHPKSVIFTDSLTEYEREPNLALQTKSTTETNTKTVDNDDQNIDGRNTMSGKLSKNDKDILSLLKREEKKDLQDMVEKRNEFLKLDKTDIPKPETDREDAFDYEHLDMGQSNNFIAKDELSDISNDVIKKDIAKSERNKGNALNYEDMDVKQLRHITDNGRQIDILNDVIIKDILQSERDRDSDFNDDDMNMKQLKNINDNDGQTNTVMKQLKRINGKDGQSNISNDIINRDISCKGLGDSDYLTKISLKRHESQPGSSSENDENLRKKMGSSDTNVVIQHDDSITDKIKDGLQRLNELKIKKIADGDEKKKRKEFDKPLKTKIDLGFHTYINENNELILKSLDSRTPLSRYPKDSVIIAKCDLKDPFELKIPFSKEQYLWLQIKDKENLTTNLPDTAKSSKISLMDKKQIPKLHKINEQVNTTVKNATRAVKLINKDIVKAQMKDIYKTYENELLPLQQSLTRLKQDVDDLILQQKTIRNNLLSKRLRIQGNRKCGCVKKL